MSTKKTYWIEFVNDRSLQIEEGQTILEASLAAGIPHYHECGGNGKCSTCRVMIHRGAEFLSPFSRKEITMRKKVFFPENIRLACQTFVHGSPVKLQRIIRDETDRNMYASEGVPDNIEYLGEERELALFFLDIRNFTPFIEQYPPFDVIHVIRRLFRLFRVAIENHNGSIIETEGDGFYAVFGIRESIRDAVRHGFAAGQAILDEVALFNQHYMEPHFFHQFQVGIGLHAGRVITGNIGIGVNNNLAAMGLPVNIASRIQSATRELNNSFLVSDHVFRLLDNGNNVPQKQIPLKGVTKSIIVHLFGKPFS